MGDGHNETGDVPGVRQRQQPESRPAPCHHNKRWDKEGDKIMAMIKDEVIKKEINIGSKVRFKHNGRLYERLYDYLNGYDVGVVVTPNSPVGQALAGKTVGSKFTVNTPGGLAEIEVIEVR